jgi:hypothetical protein
VHDFHPPIAASGLYWVAQVPDGALTMGADGRTATLELKDVPVIDQPRWPARDAEATPARLSYRCVWTATDAPVSVHDATKQFAFDGWGATCQLEASVEVPSTGFRWQSDPLGTSRAAFGVIGRETNGRYVTA